MCNKKEFACILEPVINQNHTFKKTLAKICQETDLKWVKLPPLHCLELECVLEVDSN